MTLTTAAVDVIRLGRTFGKLDAVRDLHFQVGAGELFGIVGPDGAGKTTTLRMLAGVMKPTRGDATVYGVSVVDAPEDVKHDIAYMSQGFGLYTDLTVLENIDFYADLYGVSRADRSQRLERLFAFSNLGPFTDRLAGNLSGGMKQKLSLCCALIHHPRVMLLDEPTFGVDPISRRDLWLILHEMVGEGVTVIVSTAYLDEAERCDRVLMLHRGATVAVDTPADLQRDYMPRLLSIEAAQPRVLARRLRHLTGVRHVTLFGDSVHVALDPAAGAADAITEELAAGGVATSAAVPIPPSLEDVFIEFVSRGEDDA